MSYITILDSFAGMIESTFGNKSLAPTYPASSGSSSPETYSEDSGSGEEEPVPNPAYVLVSGWKDQMTATKEQIFNSLDTLFNDPDDESETPDLNFHLINGYADGSSSFVLYHKDTEEFTEDANYFYVRGNLYDMLPKANEGQYVNKYYPQVKSLVDICTRNEELYSKFPTPPVSSEGETISKLESFWSKYYDEFESEINSQMNVFLVVKAEFFELVDFVKQYKNLFYTVSQEISKIDIFIGSMNKTVNAPKTRLSDSYANVTTDGFGMYSEKLGAVYNIFTEALKIREISSFSNNDDYNEKLRKICVSEVLVYYNYFNLSKQYLDWINAYRKKYEI